MFPFCTNPNGKATIHAQFLLSLIVAFYCDTKGKSTIRNTRFSFFSYGILIKYV